MAWPVEKELRLRNLWSEGRTGKQIAAILGGGLTRNAVLGKARRMGLPARNPAPAGRHDDQRYTNPFYAPLHGSARFDVWALWKAGFDTYDIAQLLVVHESVIANYIAKRREREREYAAIGAVA